MQADASANVMQFLARPLWRRVIWVLFAVVFYFSGQAATILVLEPGSFAGGIIDWILVGIFPLLVPGFFLVNRRYGCASGACRMPASAPGKDKVRVSIMRMPGA